MDEDGRQLRFDPETGFYGWFDAEGNPWIDPEPVEPVCPFAAQEETTLELGPAEESEPEPIVEPAKPAAKKKVKKRRGKSRVKSLAERKAAIEVA